MSWGSNFMLFQVDICTFAITKLKYSFSLSYRAKVFAPSSSSGFVASHTGTNMWCAHRLPDMSVVAGQLFNMTYVI